MRAITFLSSILLSSIAFANTLHPDTNQNKAVALQAIDLMQNYVITRDQVDWGSFRSTALNTLGDAPTLEVRDQVIYRLLESTNTNHSFYRDESSGRIIRHADFSCRVEVTDDYELPDNIGYVRVDSFQSATREDSVRFANDIQSQIIAQDEKELVGWVVDLRRNSGGNMWPMLAGISSILGNGVHGHFVDPSGKKTKWGIHNGKGVLGNTYISSVGETYAAHNTDLPTAVLSSKRTSSSGEAMLIAFKQLPNVVFIGQKSCGLSTANKKYELINGDSLFITVSTMADRELVEYGDGVDVDIVSTNALQDAATWIHSVGIVE